MRSFYYSSPKKIDSDARHLLLQVRMEEEADKYWKVISWEVRDLSSLEVQLKTEFNVGSKEFKAPPSKSAVDSLIPSDSPYGKCYVLLFRQAKS